MNGCLNRDQICHTLLRLALPKRRVLSTLLPQEGEVQKKKDVAHDGACREEPRVQKGVEPNNVERDWQEEERCQRRALGPKAEQRDEVDHRAHPHDIAATHEQRDELEGLRRSVHLRRWWWEDTERAQNRGDHEQGKKDLADGCGERGEFHSVSMVPDVERSGKALEGAFLGPFGCP